MPSHNTGLTDEPVGMSDIAAAAGVAVSTVSRALSGARGVGAARRAQIMQIALDLGYLSPVGNTPERPVPARQARITAVTPESDRWIFGSILAGLHDVLAPAGSSLSMLQGLSASDRVRLLADSDPDADLLVLVPAPPDLTPEQIRAVRRVPLVVAGSLLPGIPSVGIDDVAVGEKATNHLVNLGARRVAYVYYGDHDGSLGVATENRRRGYRRAIARAGVEPWEVEVPFGEGAGREAAETLLASDSLPPGIFCASDEMAAQMMAVFRQAGVTDPRDFSIIGVDDHPIAGMLGLTTIAQSAREQGRAAAALALRLLRGEQPTEAIALPTRLVVRETTRRMEPQESRMSGPSARSASPSA